MNPFAEQQPVPESRGAAEAGAAGKSGAEELPSELDVLASADTSTSTGSGFGFRSSGSTASRKPFLAFGALLLGCRGSWELFLGLWEGPEDKNVALAWPGGGEEAGSMGEGGAAGGAVGELLAAVVFSGRMTSIMPLLTSSSTVSMAELFPTRSLTPMWRRWERAWLPSPFRFSNCSPHRTQVKSADVLGRLLAGAVGGDDRWAGRLGEDAPSCCSSVLRCFGSSSIIL